MATITRSSSSRRKPVTLRQAFDPKLNALNAVRLAMAVGVIFWHSFPLTGEDIGFAPLRQFVGEAWVDGFFAISGFLITRSWFHTPRANRYAGARATRILPAFWVCIILTAIVAAPISLAMQGGNWRPLITSADPYLYVAKNSAVWIFQAGIAGTPNDIPVSGVWNGSLWTLGWECLCYLGVLALGVTGLIWRKWCLPVAFVAVWLLLAAVVVTERTGNIHAAGRFGVMFLAGALIYQFRRRIYCTWPLVVVAIVITGCTQLLSDYRLVGAVFWAYAVISIGVLLKAERLRLPNDISYGVYIYAFPIQQLAVIATGGFTPILFGVMCTVLVIPVAAASWFVIEKPVLDWRKARLKRTPTSPETSIHSG